MIVTLFPLSALSLSFSLSLLHMHTNLCVYIYMYVLMQLSFCYKHSRTEEFRLSEGDGHFSERVWVMAANRIRLVLGDVNAEF